MIYHLGPNIQRKIWGGKKLEQLKKVSADEASDPVVETWEISIHPDGPSSHNGKVFELTDSEELPYLVKLIDTGDELSVQVHPDDEYAKIHENSSGKSECWLILDAENDAGIYLGLKPGVTKESFLEGLNQKSNMSTFLNFYKVSAGDFFFVPAGTIHAIGGGITMAEVQQSSGITYRVWDWNRVDSKGNPRELHIKKSLDVINFNPKANTKEHFLGANNLFDKKGLNEIITHSSFKFSLVNLKKNESIEIPLLKSSRLSSVLNLKGNININGETVVPYSSVIFRDETKLVITNLESFDSSLLFLS